MTRPRMLDLQTTEKYWVHFRDSCCYLKAKKNAAETQKIQLPNVSLSNKVLFCNQYSVYSPSRYHTNYRVQL